jgi:predicted transcriptional regulator
MMKWDQQRLAEKAARPPSAGVEKTIQNLPDQVRELPDDLIIEWVRAYNGVRAHGFDERESAVVAWNAVRARQRNTEGVTLSDSLRRALGLPAAASIDEVKTRCHGVIDDAASAKLAGLRRELNLHHDAGHCEIKLALIRLIDECQEEKTSMTEDPRKQLQLLAEARVEKRSIPLAQALREIVAEDRTLADAAIAGSFAESAAKKTDEAPRRRLAKLAARRAADKTIPLKQALANVEREHPDLVEIAQRSYLT